MALSWASDSSKDLQEAGTGPCCRTLGSGNEAYADLHGSQILCQWKQQGV